ncbi:MAG: hypothetical protein RJB13_2085, partial [Pseudomonadota bacterium]
ALVKPPSPTRRYGMAGCGLGSVLLPSGPQFIASIINGLLWNQVFMISSGTSNCQSDSLQQVGFDQESYMKNNYRTIASEAAQGRGESLMALAESLGCTPDSHSAFAAFTQNNHRKIFSKPGAVAALESLKKELIQENALISSCELVVSSGTSVAR